MKGSVYRGYKVMPYSTALATPLSNMEAQLNYKDVADPAIVVSFPLLDDPNTSLLAWTTTPWTLPSNVALCVSKEALLLKSGLTNCLIYRLRQTLNTSKSWTRNRKSSTFS
jgi:isoleucyl-tRNA synthetase